MKIDKFLEIEKKHSLCTDTIAGVNFWEYLRFEFWQYHVCMEKLNLGQPQGMGEQSFLVKAKMFGSLMWNSMLYKLSKVGQSDICIINHERRVKQNNFYECIYTEWISKYYVNSIVLERPYNGMHSKPIMTRNILFTDYIVAKANVFYITNKTLHSNKYKNIYRQVSRKLEQPLKEILEFYKVDINLETIYEIAVKRILMYLIEYKEYEKLISKISPKLIVEVCHYSMHAMIVNEIANKNGIVSIELQHGTMHAEHIAYQYCMQGKINQLPSFLLSFSDYWTKYIKMPFGSTQVCPVGFPYFEEQIEKNKNNLHKNQTFKTIIFISQGTIGKYLSKIAVELYDKMDSDKFKIIYKLHPGEYSFWKDKYEWLIESGINVIDSSEHSIYKYFSLSDIQIGVYSTALYEGLGFGLETYIYNIGHSDTMNDIVKLGYAKVFNCVEEVLSMILRTNRDEKNSDIFWKKNSLNNIVKMIDDELL